MQCYNSEGISCCQVKPMVSGWFQSTLMEILPILSLPVFLTVNLNARETCYLQDHTDRQPNRQTDRQTDTHTEQSRTNYSSTTDSNNQSENSRGTVESITKQHSYQNSQSQNSTIISTANHRTAPLQPAGKKLWVLVCGRKRRGWEKWVRPWEQGTRRNISINFHRPIEI